MDPSKLPKIDPNLIKDELSNLESFIAREPLEVRNILLGDPKSPEVVAIARSGQLNVSRFLSSYDPKPLLNLNLDTYFDSKSFGCGPNLFQNYRNNALLMRGVPTTTLAWWSLRGTAAYYANLARVTLGGGLAQAGLALKVLGAGALGFAAGTALDQGQEAVFGKSYTAEGVKAFLEQPSIWGSAEAAPKELLDAWDENFAWTNFPKQALDWLRGGR